MPQFLRTLATGAIWAAVGLAAAVPLFVWGSDKAPEFYGAFTAAMVAAIAVVLGAYYQAELTRRRDDELANREQIAEATDPFLWLGHAIGEMNFIAEFLRSILDRKRQGFELDMPLNQYREIVSAPFMAELRERAITAARLSPQLGIAVAPVLYDTFRIVDRIYHFRGALDDRKFDSEDISSHLAVTQSRIATMQKARSAVMLFLANKGIEPSMLYLDGPI